MENKLQEKLLAFTNILEWYHRYELQGYERVPKEGPAIIAVNHSLATYDGVLLGAALYKKLGRMAYGLADRHFFRFQKIGEISKKLHLVEGTHENAMKLLEDGEIVAVAPGGMKEAIRSSEEKRQVYWGERLGFAQLAYKMQVPIILAACPKADDIYEVLTGKLTKWGYKYLKLPLVLPLGLGASLIPRPVKLKHTLSHPFYPPSYREGEEGHKDLLKFHHQLVSEMQYMLKKH